MKVLVVPLRCILLCVGVSFFLTCPGIDATAIMNSSSSSSSSSEDNSRRNAITVAPKKNKKTNITDNDTLWNNKNNNSNDSNDDDYYVFSSLLQDDDNDNDKNVTTDFKSTINNTNNNTNNIANSSNNVSRVTTYEYLYENKRHEAPQWMIDFMNFRKHLFLQTVEPIIVWLLGPVDENDDDAWEPMVPIVKPTKIRWNVFSNTATTAAATASGADVHTKTGTSITTTTTTTTTTTHASTTKTNAQLSYTPSYDPDYNPHDYHYHHQYHRRRLGFLPNYVEDISAFKETSMSFATLIMLVFLLCCLFLIFLSCFYHNQKTSPLFSSPRRHRLPKLVPPPLPVDGYFKWVKVCFFVSDEEIIHRIGYDALIFLRFHRLALRCIVKMSVFSFVVLLPLNFTGSGHANAKDLKGYVGSLFFTDFLRFTMANVSGGSPRLWVHCFAAYLLTAIVVRELLVEYETFNSIRHTYLLSREPHLRTVMVTNIPRHLRSRAKINSYFRHVYPQAVQQVILCQNVMTLEKLVAQRTNVLSQLEKELLLLCRTEKYKLFQPEQQRRLGKKALTACCRCSCCGSNPSGASWTMAHVFGFRHCLERLQLVPGTQERLTRLYTDLESLNQDIEQEQRRRRRVMKMLDRMEAGGDGSKDIDYLLALSSPFASTEQQQKNHERLGLVVPKNAKKQQLVTSSPLSPMPEEYFSTNTSIHVAAKEDTISPPPQVQDEESHGLAQQQQEPTEQVLPAASRSGGGGSGVLRARSPQPSSSVSKGNPESDVNNESDDETSLTKRSRKSSTMSKAKQKMQRLSRMVGSSLAGGTATNVNDSNAIAVATAEAANDGYNPPATAEYTQMADRVTLQQDNGSGIGKSLSGDFAQLPPARVLGNNSQRPSSKSSQPPAHIEDHLNEVSDKAFVVMHTFTAATIAIQSMHSSRPGSMQVSTAPEPRDILWNNIYISKGATRTRSYVGEVLVLLIITFYVVPIALVSLLVSESALVSSSPRLAQLDQASAFFSSAIAMIQPLCIVAIQQLLPPLFLAIGRAEGLVSFSEVQMRAFSRYFLFQVLNVFLVTTIAGSIFDTIAIIVENPEAAFEMLGNSLPRMSSFFITFVTIKTFLGLGMELVRIMSLVQATLRYLIFPNATLRTQRSVLLGMRAIDDPGWFPFHKVLAQDMLVVVLSVVFAVVAPLVLLPCALFCTFSRIMWTHHHLYIYESVFESGGQFWPKIFRRFVFGLIIAQMTITGQFILKEARHEAYATIALMFMTYLFLRSTRARYDPTSSTLPLEVATVMDIKLHEEQQQAAAAAALAAQRAGEGPLTGPQVHARNEQGGGPAGPQYELPFPELGARIGPFDPFENAYIQPALRANPRARPEQPFPPAQLGREDFGSSIHQTVAAASGSDRGGISNHGVVKLDSSARVRLKGFHQLDRRNLNMWWDNQLEKCSDQNIFRILIGEECGKLKISEQEFGAPSQIVRRGLGMPATPPSHEMV